MINQFCQQCQCFQVKPGDELEAVLTMIAKLRLQDLPDEEGRKKLLDKIGRIELAKLKFELLLSALRSDEATEAEIL